MAPQSDEFYKRLFKASPGKILVLRPGNFEIIAATEEYLKATGTTEHDLIGKPLFEAFPDEPGDQQGDGVRNLAESLRRVLSFKTADIMPVQRYPIPLPDGSFEERFWSPVNSPVLNDAGEVEFLMHRVEDVTEVVRNGGEGLAPKTQGDAKPLAVQDIVLRSQELRQALSNLQVAQARAEKADRQRLDVLESISDAFMALDKQWKLTYVNEQASIVLERSREELLGKNVWDEFPEAIGSEFQRQYEYALNTQETAGFLEFYPPLEKWFDVSAYPIPDGLAIYFRDVTNQREHQAQLRLVEAALSRQNDIVMITEADTLDDPEGPRIVYVNDAFERLTGYSKNDAIGRTPRLLQGPDTSRLQLDRIRTALIRKEPIRCELLNYGKTGESYWLELDITPLFDDFGHCTHFVAVQRDITQRKLQEAELQRAQERFQLISRATNDVIWDWDLLTNQVWWNEAITNCFGYVRSELEAGPESWVNRIHPDDKDRVVEKIHAAMDGEHEFWSDEYRFLKSDGQSAEVIDRGFVIRDQSGKATRMVGSMLDVTERKDLEQRLRESLKLEAVGQLTGGGSPRLQQLIDGDLGQLGNADRIAQGAGSS